MDFLRWHYSKGLNMYFRRWIFAMSSVVQYFSLTLLPASLFSPWKRMTLSDNSPGFNLARMFEAFTFNLISRFIGAIVRTVLFITGLLILMPTVVAGLVGLCLWLVIPLIGIPYYLWGEYHIQRQLGRLVADLRRSPDPVTVLLNSEGGKFLLDHTGLALVDLSSPRALPDLQLLDPNAAGFSPLVELFISKPSWDETFLRTKNVIPDDLVTAAKWWDDLHPAVAPADNAYLSRPGIGLELLFGYTPRLNQYAVDLSLPQSFSHHLIGREEVTNRMERSLLSGTNVIIVGQPGVGKKTVLLEFAKKAMEGRLGKQLSYHRVMELDYNFLLSESLDINRKKALLSEILEESTQAGNIILAIKDIHRLTHPDVEQVDFTDLFEQHLEKRKLKIIAVSSQADYERFIAPNSRLRKFFNTIEVTPASRELAMEILLDSASYWEKQRHLTFTVPALRAVIDGCDRYITDTPFPEKALELLDQLVVYGEKNKITQISVPNVNQVIGELTGISLTRLTSGEKKLLSRLEDILHQYLIGQDQAIRLISQSLRARSVGAKNDKRPVGSFLFMGPTGVGKTQTAKALAKVYFGDEKQILRFDMAEYAGTEGLDRLIGSQSRNFPGTLTTALKNKPASLLLLDEIEKSPPLVFNLFLSLLDEGVITDAFGKKINCRNVFVIATSNAGSEFIRQQVAAGVLGENLQKQVIEYIQQQHIFTPEFLNRFDGVVIYEPLDESQMVQIARLMLGELQANLHQKNLYLQITDDLCRHIATEGFSSASGARPLRRIIDITLGDVIGRAVLEDQLQEGDKFELVSDDRNSYSLHILSPASKL
jgi:ATP-dependent Clp protease ATP-binding subunit ClpC